MTDLTPVELAVAEAMCDAPWPMIEATALPEQRRLAEKRARTVVAAARPHIEAELRAKLADALQAIADEYYEQVRKGVNKFSGGPIRVASIGDGWTAAARMVRGAR